MPVASSTSRIADGNRSCGTVRAGLTTHPIVGTDPPVATSDRDSIEKLSADLEAAAVRALGEDYDNINYSVFRRRLRRPPIELCDSRVRLGVWVREPRSLRISSALFLEHGWGTVLDVLKHEMAHQYVDEVLGQTGETAHGPAFRRVCEERGIEPDPVGTPTSVGATADPERRVLERIARLLALAESPNEHEARSAAAAAQRLMLKHNIDAVRRGVARSYGFRHLGKPTGRVEQSLRTMASILSEHFFVEAIFVPVWRPREGKRGTALEICGTQANMETAEYVHEFLTGTAERLWVERKRVEGIPGDGGRRAFVAGVMAGFDEKLCSKREENRREGLVWAGDADLHRYFRFRHPRIRTVWRSGVSRTDDYSAGRDAGRGIVLHRGIEGGHSHEPAPLLPPRGSES